MHNNLIFKDINAIYYAIIKFLIRQTFFLIFIKNHKKAFPLSNGKAFYDSKLIFLQSIPFELFFQILLISEDTAEKFLGSGLFWINEKFFRGSNF